MSSEPLANIPTSRDSDMAKVIELLESIDNHLRSMSGLPSLTSLPEMPTAGTDLQETPGNLPDAQQQGQ